MKETTAVTFASKDPIAFVISLPTCLWAVVTICEPGELTLAGSSVMQGAAAVRRVPGEADPPRPGHRNVDLEGHATLGRNQKGPNPPPDPDRRYIKAVGAAAGAATAGVIIWWLLKGASPRYGPACLRAP
jgi:hypothetical protein